MIKVEVTDEKKIKIYNNGVLIIVEKNYNNVVSIINELKEVIQEADPNVFILITDAQEVIGQGFTRPILPTEVTNQLKAQGTIAKDATAVVTDNK